MGSPNNTTEGLWTQVVPLLHCILIVLVILLFVFLLEVVVSGTYY